MSVRIVDEHCIDDAIAEIDAATMIVLDTEFHAERSYSPTLYLVQVHVPDGSTWVIDPLVPDLLQRMGPTLRATPWLLHAGSQDLRLMQKAIGGVPDRTMDVQIAAGLVTHRYPSGLGTIMKQWTGQELAKTATLSDWSARPLTAEQVAYAAEDVLLLDLWDALRNELERLDRLDIAYEAFEEHKRMSTDPPDADRLWRSLSVANSLDPHDAIVCRALAAWREAHAERTNKPARFVLGESALKQLARSKPTTKSELQGNRRLARSLVGRHGDELIQIIGEAAARPESEWPKTIRVGSAAARSVDWLGVFADVDGVTFRYAKRLVLPKILREDLALVPSGEAPAIDTILGPWRSRLLGARIHRAMTGHLSLHLASTVEGVDAAFSTE